MRKGKQRRAFEETLKSKSKSLFSDQIKQEDEDAEIEEKENKEQKGFFGCYLLTSISPRHKGHTYIGSDSFHLVNDLNMGFALSVQFKAFTKIFC